MGVTHAHFSDNLQAPTHDFFRMNLTRMQWTALFVAVAVAAGSTLCLQLVQTRILSVLYYNHLVYITVTLALLGFGISGVFVAIAAPRIKRVEELISGGLAGLALSIPIALGIASYMPTLIGQPAIFTKLIASYLLLIIPFIFAGLTLASIFMAGGKIMHRLYFTDLVASAGGILVFVLLLTTQGAEGLVWICSWSAMLAFGAVSLAFRLGLVRTAVPVLLLGTLFFFTHGWLIGDKPDFAKVGCNVPGWNNLKVETSRWTTIAKIDVLDHPSFYWRLAPQFPLMERKMITQDRDAVMFIASPQLVKTRWDSARSAQPFINCEAISFIAHPHPADSLIIGVGGGNDIVNAAGFNARHIVGVEINPETIRLMTHEYADYAVWPRLPNVNLLCMDGRNYVAGTTRRFDTINISGIDTFAALSTGAYVLSENYLYTVEALKDYLKTLKPNGVLNIYRWNFQIPRESLRLCNLFLEASRERGNPHPEKCIMLVGMKTAEEDQYRWASMLVKNEPFTGEEVHRVLDQIERQPSLALIYLPKIFAPDEQAGLESHFFQHDQAFYKPNREAFAALIDAPSPEGREHFENVYPYNITPVYDNRPFFFEYHKMSEIFSSNEPNNFGVRGVIVHYTLYYLLIVTSLVSYAGMIVPLHFYAKDALQAPRAPSLMVFFASLGFGFMFVELGVIQSLAVYLGHPMYSLGLVLAGLLLTSGVGSYLTGREASLARLVKRGMIGSFIVIGLWIILMPLVISATLGCSPFIRGLLALLSLVPLGIFMGIPFATGIRHLSEGPVRFIPWAWGINGLTSVMASILAILLAMRIGFQAVLILGAVSYLIGYLAAKRFIPSA
ncbi:MAG TPA: hypothetical protein VL981_14850 [Candidatus Methylacidiphilales bacterium]|nr:hypothetical protein [Candidatus Methylacidiphilales bacterium]